MLTVERVDSLQGREDLQPPWRELLARSPQRNLFLTPEWITTWWDHFGAGRDLWLLVVREGGRMVGLAPMTVTRDSEGRLPARVLGFMRHRHISRSDFIIPERHDEVLGALARYWRDHAGAWDVLRLEGVPGESDSLARAAGALAAAGLDPMPIRAQRVLGYLPVAGPWEHYLRGRSHRFRRNLRVGGRDLERAGQVDFERARSPEAVERTLTWLFDLEAASWKADTEGVAFDDRDRHFHAALTRRFAAEGGVENRFVLLDGKVIAGLHSFIYDRVYTLLLTFYDPAHHEISPGRDLVRQALRDCCDEGVIREVDFNGDSPYIRHWTDTLRPLRALTAHNRRIYSRVILGLKTAKRILRPAAPPPAADAAAREHGEPTAGAPA
jgi:CelD/BcsL family acetyltransferase involved in cellulose biosynthesis